jgi:nucleobase:cation symporter-1, NCS1 family
MAVQDSFEVDTGQSQLPPDAIAPGPAHNQVPVDRPGQVETRGIDYIPADERHGRARDLFVVWAASNITYLYIVLGGTLILLGLNVWQSMLVLVIGNLFWLLVGLLAISGPASGVPSEIITRVMFGVRGNRLYNAIPGWLVGVCYEAINLSIGALAGFALIHKLGGGVTTPEKLLVIFGTAAATFVISVYGHATIVKLSGYFTAALLICSVVLGIFVVTHAHFNYEPSAAFAVHGAKLWAAIAVGVTLIASSPLSWGTSADYARYLPQSTSPRSVALWTTLGGLLPALLLGALGVLAGTVVNMTDPQTSLAAILPGWFYPIFLLVIVVGSMTNNVLTAYSTGLALLAVGIPWKRAITVIFDAIIALAITCYALFISNFLDTLNNLLALTVALLGPALAIYGTDILLRRNRYKATELHDESSKGPIWFAGGFNLAGMTAIVLGTAAATLCVNTTLVVGPVSNWLSGADISAIVGPVIGAAVYALMFRRFSGVRAR